ncbi:hypothetical protein LTR05_007465 [Lithohypha guttulata]|uniref:Uncharacterized protein n=1 Tax=Lithohypha guttulata TaxID=1690604 RepID=A0AAN7SV64_9EURO|nr:hypothetical protein LTR05_007465 [Lithohypha guttulata]
MRTTVEESLSTKELSSVLELDDPAWRPSCITTNKTTGERCGNRPARMAHTQAEEDAGTTCEELLDQQPIDEALIELAKYCLCRGGMNAAGETHQDEASIFAEQWKGKLIKHGYGYLKSIGLVELTEQAVDGNIEPAPEAIDKSRVSLFEPRDYEDLVNHLANTSFHDGPVSVKHETVQITPVRPTRAQTREHDKDASFQSFITRSVTRNSPAETMSLRTSWQYSGKVRKEVLDRLDTPPSTTESPHVGTGAEPLQQESTECEVLEGSVKSLRHLVRGRPCYGPKAGVGKWQCSACTKQSRKSFWD